MRKTSLYILAASIAFIPAAASAQHGPPPGPPAGHTWHGGGGGGGGMVGMPAHGPNVMMYRNGGGGHPMHPGPNFRHGRLQRGFVINPFWFGQQFRINNWQMYGFSDPGSDGRWVRYYDDAYLIDRGGRVMDTRYGMDWDRYGEDWDMEDGIPAYRGSRDWNPGDDDYDWAEEHGDGRDGREDHGHGGHREVREVHVRGGPMPGPGYGYGSGGSYGYGAYAYPIVIETVTTSGGGYTEEVTEEYVEVRQRARAHRRARCVCTAPRPAPRRPAPRPARPRPPAGERG